jgi:hypothetical protein
VQDLLLRAKHLFVAAAIVVAAIHLQPRPIRARGSVILHGMINQDGIEDRRSPFDSSSPTLPDRSRVPLSLSFIGRFAPGAGLVNSRQTFVRCCHLGWTASRSSPRTVSDLFGGASEHEHCTPLAPGVSNRRGLGLYRHRNGISIIKGPSSLLNLLPRRNVTAWA